MTSLALFDLDHTLIPIDSDQNWGQFLVRIQAVDGDWYAKNNQQFYEDYRNGCLDIQAFLRFALSALKQYPRKQLNAWHEQFMQEVIQPHIRPEALALVDRHRQAGDVLVMVTATNSFVTRPIATAFGIEHLIATEPECDAQGEYTGAVVGIPSFREGKVHRVNAWLVERQWSTADFSECYFYSDSHNDLPLLQWATKPVCTNPDPILRAEAVRHNWPILDLFE